MKTNTSFTIHTELIDGTLSGARNIYLGANSTCHLYVIPREEIVLANSISDISGQPAFYILLGDCNSQERQAYIGQTTDFANRKNDHVQKKDFWQVALVFISDNHKIYGDDVKYLEFLGIEAAQNVGSFSLLNGANPRKPSIAPFRVNDMEVFFRDIQLLARFYGCDIFDKPQIKAKQQKLYYIHALGRPADGIGFYDETACQFILKKGSVLAAAVSSSYKSIETRKKFIDEHCKKDKDQIVLIHDVTLNSPSAASGLILGRSSNGWIDWKDENGNDLGSSRTLK